MRHSSYHTPSLPSRIGRVLLVLLCSAGVLSGGFLLLCGLGVLSPAAISQQVSAWLHPPAASTPASAPAEDLSLPEENDPFQGVFLSLAQLGFDEILLTDCGFPTQGDLDSLRAVEEKEETLETFCRQLQGALADTPVTLSVMGQRDSVTADPVSGQTTALLATFGRVWTQAEDQEALAAFDPVVLPAVS